MITSFITIRFLDILDILFVAILLLPVIPADKRHGGIQYLLSACFPCTCSG